MDTITADQHNDLDLIKKMEDEHLRLQRQVRMVQADRLHRSMGVHPQFKRQDQQLRNLKKEYINLIKDLKIASSGAHKTNNKKMKCDLNNALLLRTKSEVECEEGVTMMKQIDKLLRRNSKEMLRLRKLANTTEGQLDERRCQSEHRLVSTENQLETAMLRFNAVQFENKKIREEIEHMLQDRAIFNQAWSKMMHALNKGKKFLTDLFESSTLAYDQRDEWCAKLRSVQEKGKMDQMLQMQEMRELQRAFDNELKVFNFLAKKGLIRINEKQEEREAEQKRLEEEETIKQYDIHVKILEEITSYTLETNISKIIEDFVKREFHNFSIYQLLTEFCAENEVLTRDVQKIKRDIVDRRDWNEMMESKREEKLNKLRQQVEEQKSRTETLRSKVEGKVQLLTTTMEKIGELFKMLDCSLDPFQKLLGDKGPTLQQLNLSLHLIADKIKENIEIVYYFERVLQKKLKSSASRLKKYTVYAEPSGRFTPVPINVMVPADPCPACVEARWLSRVCDAPETPLDRQRSVRALRELAADPAFVRSDRVHALPQCRVPASRLILARRYMNQ
ncbi:uncharacterized protein LOC115451629 isoform X2 [Manduca sexta]|uniref:uncharacterized protein LOC115451629 isoform X2 n=1 Tax=Manduca sexta TaxID=7130 RepID=UPI00188E7FFB|nr:uncharacterized protein LOC115451629 isoform X2 [Manduca sexta]